MLVLSKLYRIDTIHLIKCILMRMKKLRLNKFKTKRIATRVFYAASNNVIRYIANVLYLFGILLDQVSSSYFTNFFGKMKSILSKSIIVILLHENAS
jgi:hypothetical protein